MHVQEVLVNMADETSIVPPDKNLPRRLEDPVTLFLYESSDVHLLATKPGLRRYSKRKAMK